MKLFFLKLDGKYISKWSNLGPIPVIDSSYSIEEAKYWDKLSTVRGINTKLHKQGYNTCIAQARVEIELIYT